MTSSIPNQTPVKNVLVFPFGSEISNEIVRSLFANKYFKAVLATSDQDILNLEIGNDMAFLPFVSDPGFERALRILIEERDIAFVIPAHDDVALLLSELELPDRCAVIGQSAAINRIARFKKNTYENLSDVVPVPRTYPDTESTEFPVFVKPDRGQGSKDSSLIQNRASLDEFLGDREPDDFVFSEHLPGDEYTIDCFSRNGEVLFAGPRTRERTINGISTLSRTLEEGPERDVLLKMAEKISGHLCVHGLWFFQAKKDREGVLRLLEIAPRVSGTMMVNRAKGINFVELALWQAMGKPIELNPRPETTIVRRTLDPHYQIELEFERLLVDFDDTLIIDGQLNVPLMAMIFSSKNDRKPVILITKHKDGILDQTLDRFGISAIFDEILHLDPADKKSRFVRKGDLLVDDSFAERHDVSASGATSISLDMIELFENK